MNMRVGIKGRHRSTCLVTVTEACCLVKWGRAVQVLRELDGQGYRVLPWANEHEPNTLQPVNMHGVGKQLGQSLGFSRTNAYWQDRCFSGLNLTR